MKLDWWTRKALSHFCPFAHGGDFVRKFGIYNTTTGMRVWGLSRTTFNKVRRWLGRPAHVSVLHEPCPQRLRKFAPPDRVYSLK